MNVTVSRCHYIVREPCGRRYTVSKARVCSCGNPKCVHADAVALYLKMGGDKAVDNHELTLEQRAERIQNARKRYLAGDTSTMSPMSVAILRALSTNTPEERTEWIREYAMPCQMPDEYWIDRELSFPDAVVAELL